MLRATGNTVLTNPDVALEDDPDMSVDETDLALSAITATTATTHQAPSGLFRPASSMASAATTIVHIHQPNKGTTKNVIFYPDGKTVTQPPPLTSYHTVIKVT